jgi:hypothetical protein
MSETMTPPSAGSALDKLRTLIRGPVAGPHDADPPTRRRTRRC